MEKVYKNSHYLFIAVLLMAIVGFWKTYFGKIPTFSGVSGLMHFHAVMVLAWLGILIAQPTVFDWLTRLHFYLRFLSFYHQCRPMESILVDVFLKMSYLRIRRKCG